MRLVFVVMAVLALPVRVLRLARGRRATVIIGRAAAADQSRSAAITGAE